LNFIAHGFVDCHLSRDCSAARSFGTSSSFEQRTSITPLNTTHLCGTFTLREWPVKLSFKCSDSIRLFARDQGSLTTNVTRGKSTTAAASRASRELTAAPATPS